MQETILPDGTKKAAVHYLLVTRGEHRIACIPSLKELSSGPKRLEPWHRSQDARAVTCQLCKETPAYKAGVAEIEFQTGRRINEK